MTNKNLKIKLSNNKITVNNSLINTKNSNISYNLFAANTKTKNNSSFKNKSILQYNFGLSSNKSNSMLSNNYVLQNNMNDAINNNSNFSVVNKNKNSILNQEIKLGNNSFNSNNSNYEVPSFKTNSIKSRLNRIVNTNNNRPSTTTHKENYHSVSNININNYVINNIYKLDNNNKVFKKIKPKEEVNNTAFDKISDKCSNKSNLSVMSGVEFGTCKHLETIKSKIIKIKKANLKNIDDFLAKNNESKKSIITNFLNRFSNKFYNIWDKFLLENDITNRDYLLNEIFKIDKKIVTAITNDVEIILLKKQINDYNIIYNNLKYKVDNNISNFELEYLYDNLAQIKEKNSKLMDDYNSLKYHNYRNKIETSKILINKQSEHLKTNLNELSINIQTNKGYADSIILQAKHNLRSKLANINSKLQEVTGNFDYNNLIKRVRNLEVHYKKLLKNN